MTPRPPTTPAPSFGDVAGYRYEWRVAANWRVLAADTTARCRAGASPHGPACGRQAVAELARRHGRSVAWWAYCEDHLHARVALHDGVVWESWLAPTAEGGGPS